MLISMVDSTLESLTFEKYVSILKIQNHEMFDSFKLGESSNISICPFIAIIQQYPECLNRMSTDKNMNDFFFQSEFGLNAVFKFC